MKSLSTGISIHLLAFFSSTLLFIIKFFSVKLCVSRNFFPKIKEKKQKKLPPKKAKKISSKIETKKLPPKKGA